MIQLFGSTHTGLVRESNQDCFIIRILSGTLAFAVLCDGMGGENGGNVASRIVTDFCTEMLARDLHDGMTPTTLHGVMQSAVAGANALVYNKALEEPDLRGMGTTLILAVFWQRAMYVAYVGDSRVYCVSPRKETQLTKDHTMVQMLVDLGELAPEDAESHPKRHYITRAVGVGADVTPDFIQRELGSDELVLLCSDGLYQYLEPGGLYALLGDCLRQDSADSLIELANSKGGQDNITAVVAFVVPGPMSNGSGGIRRDG